MTRDRSTSVGGVQRFPTHDQQRATYKLLIYKQFKCLQETSETLVFFHWLFMAALWYRAGHYIFALWFLSVFYLLLLFFLA